ncbi:SusC/RagA family TonB-linked outer membrane protein [Flavobacterium sp. Sd200]|uniref:SusC/RagA family TonB-linked outer membrane protein n=1 Tax=Flavobacterium sp. Sd200 TaxID=2692211 RepID=UPI00136B9672|nr:TonB-dependent receptor [Flavobacterium sp. Sd200]MXN90856.1 SusC/RagA family TonB-linked outer membrane protein [Flavobacterium sp. Sd200]
MKKTTSCFFFRLLVLFMTLLPAISFAQGKTVSGTVVDSNNLPIPGANVLVKGTSTGVQTDVDGKFSIEVAQGNVLVFSFVGMQTQEITVGSQTTYSVSLKDDAAELEEVVVVGYGQKKKSDVTGAITSVSAKEIASRPVNNALQAIQGKAAGVDITSNERPGTMGSINIRGVRSLTASNSPLYVVDGIPLISGGIDNINPLDIEAIDILKGPSATAIYGSRGANGVVIVTTKKGKNGKFTVNLNYATTIENIDNLAPMMNASDYITFRRWARYYENPVTFPRGDQPTLANDQAIFNATADPTAFANIARGWETGTWDGSRVQSKDWTDYVTQTGVTNQYTLNVSGGSDKVKAFGSFGYLDSKGTVIGQAYERYTGKVSVDINPVDWFSFGGTMNGSYGVQNYGQSEAGRSVSTAGSLYDTARAVFSYALPYDDAGNRIIFPGGDDGVRTVIDEVNYSFDERVNTRIFASFYGQLDFGKIWSPLAGLKYRVNFGPDMSFNRNGLYLDKLSVVRSGTSYASLNANNNLSYTLDHLIFYDKQIGRHKFDLTLLQSETKFKYEYNSSAANNIPYSDQKWDALTNSNVALLSWGSGLTERQIYSYMGRINYSFNDRYDFTASGRYDGVSQLADGDKWGFFPSAALGWTIKKESFLQDVNWLDNLKLRLEVGSTGNSAIDAYSTKGPLSPLFYPTGPGLNAGTVTNTALANQDLTWEKTTAYNVGVDFSFFGNRISGQLDYFTAHTTDLLLTKNIPSVTGYTTTIANVGETKSNGLELTLNTVNIDTGNFSWDTTLSASTQDNEIVTLSTGKFDDIQNNWFIGEQLGVIYGYKSNGIWKPEDAAEMARFNANGHTFSAGNARPADLNGDYKIDENNDRTIVGNTMPKYVVGMTNTFKYKGIELSIFLYGRLKYMYNAGGEALTGRYNQRQLNYYTEINQNSDYQKPIYTSGTGDPYATSLGYEDATFIKIRNISLGYNFPKSITDKLKISSLRLYVQALNPGMIYSAIDFRDMDVNNAIFNRGFVSGLNFEF